MDEEPDEVIVLIEYRKPSIPTTPTEIIFLNGN